jgi:GT2 family glycosyltransferase
LAPCLKSVTGEADQVVLIDNGSAGSLASQIGRAAGVTVLRSSTNRGFAPAVNTGVGAARGDIVALLNDDAVARPGWLTAASSCLKDPTVAAVGPKVLLSGWYREVVLDDEEWYAPGDSRPLGRQVRSVLVGGAEVLEKAAGPGIHRLEHGQGGDRWRWTAGRRPWYVPARADLGPGSVVDVLVDGQPAPPGPVVRLVNSAGAFLDKRGYAGDIGEAAPDDGRFDQPAEAFAVSGSALAARAETWRRIGPFAEQYFAYYEDVDWCWRARLRGMRLLYDPGGTVEHRRSASSGGEHEPWVRVTSERNRTLTMVRNGPRQLVIAALRARVSNGPDEGVRAGIARSLPWALASRRRLRRHWALSPAEVWSTWAGQGTSWPSGPATALAPGPAHGT